MTPPLPDEREDLNGFEHLGMLGEKADPMGQENHPRKNRDEIHDTVEGEDITQGVQAIGHRHDIIP